MKYLVIDDHPLLREGVAGVLRQFDIQALVLHAADGEQGLAQARQHPDLAVVLVDLRMAGLDGLAVVAGLHALRPGLPALVLSSSEDPADVRRALAAGARGYCPKSAGNTTLLAALRLVLAGEVYLPPLMALEAAAPQPPAPATNTAPAPGDAPAPGAFLAARLTERQQEVLRLLCEGRPNKDIGRTLGLSEKTTKAHVTAIFRSLNVVNRTQAVLAARAAGLMPTEAAGPRT
jgi:DNA-binding NarL/FixJ family response regulator